MTTSDELLSPTDRLAEAGGPRVAVMSEPAGIWSGDSSWAEEAVGAGGGTVVPAQEADALIWLGGGNGLGEVLAEAPGIRWVHVPSAGVERYGALIGSDCMWTCGKGMASQLVAEHALTLMLTATRRIGTYARSSSWERRPSRPLTGSNVVIVGGGGIASALLAMLAPFETTTTVVRRRAEPVVGADRVVTSEHLLEVLPEADLVVLALALIPDTVGLFDARAFDAMADHAWLVSVSRGLHVVTDDLVRALAMGHIGGAALDVTDPEPLPPEHPLWALPNCVITPHVATTPEQSRPSLERRIRENVARFGRGEALLGEVDVRLGY